MSGQLPEKVVLKIDLDVDAVNASLVKVKGEIIKTKATLKDLESQLKDAFAEGNAKKVELVSEQIVLQEAELRKLTGEQKNLRQQIDLNTKSNEAANGSYEQLLRQWQLAQTELKLLEGTLQRNEDGTFRLTEEYLKASDQVNKAKEAIDNFNLSVSDGRTNVGQYSKALDPLKNEMRDVKVEVAALGRSIQAATLLQEGSAKIFGESSKTTNALKTAVEALVLIESVHNIRAGISATLGLANVTALKAQSVATTTATTATGLLAGAQQFLATNLGISAAAARGLSIALATITGAGIVIALGVAIQALVEYIGKLREAKDATDDLIPEATKNLRQQQTIAAQIRDNFLGAGSAIDETNRKNEAAIALAKARGESLTKIHDLEIKQVNDQLEAMRKVEELGGQLTKEDLAKREELNTKKQLLDAEYYKNLSELRKKDEEKYGEFLTKEFDAWKTTLQLMQEARDAVDPAKQLEAIVDAQLAATEALAKKEKDYLADKKADLERQLEFQKTFTEASNNLELSRLEFARATSIGIAQAFAQNSFAYKALFLTQQAAAVGEVIISLQEEIAGIALANAKLGAVGIPITAAQTAAAKIRAATSIATILAQSFRTFAPTAQKKGERGMIGVFGGRPHSSGGTKGYFEDGTVIEVEKDELFAVINKRSTALLGQFSALNEAGGGVSLMRAGGSLRMEDGGLAARFASTPVGGGVDTAALVNAIASLDLVVKVSDINNTQAKVAKIETRASI